MWEKNTVGWLEEPNSKQSDCLEYHGGCARFREIMRKFCPDRRKLSVSYVSLFLGKANVTVSCFSWQRIVGCRISKSKPCLLQSASWEYYFRKDCQLCKVLRKFCTQRTFWLLQLKRNSSKMLSQETGWRWQTIQNTRQVRNTAPRKKIRVQRARYM